MTDYAENKFIDWFRSNMPLPSISTWYYGFLSVMPSDGTPGTEFAFANYTRLAVSATLANWAGTQGPGTTVPSTGNSGSTSNNITMAWPIPNSDWDFAVCVGVWDAPTGGNLWLYGKTVFPAKKIIAASSVVILPGQLVIQFDN